MFPGLQWFNTDTDPGSLKSNQDPCGPGSGFAVTLMVVFTVLLHHFPNLYLFYLHSSIGSEYRKPNHGGSKRSGFENCANNFEY
jgi:hypothetical protein